MQCDRACDRRAPQRAQAGGSTETLFSLIPTTTIVGISGMKSVGSVTNSWDEVQENPSALLEAGHAVPLSHDAQERLMHGWGWAAWWKASHDAQEVLPGFLRG